MNIILLQGNECNMTKRVFCW